MARLKGKRGGGIWWGGGIGFDESVTLAADSGKDRSVGLNEDVGIEELFPRVVPCQGCSCVDAGGRNGVKAPK